MNSASRIAAAVLLLAAGAASADIPKPPPTRTDSVRETLHGVEVVDPYRWLEDQESPETRAWIEAQNRYTGQVMGSVPGREALERRLTELLRVESVGLPFEAGGFYFYTRRTPEQELSLLCRRKGLRGPEEVLVDPHPLSPDRTTSAGFMDVSHDGQLLAYSIRRGGVDEVEVHLRDLRTGTELPDRLPAGRYMSFSLKPDGSGFYYVRHDSAGPRLFHHAVGSPATADRMLFGEGYAQDKGMDASLSEDGRWLTITIWHGSAARKTEVYLQNAAEGGPVVPVVNDVDARFTASVAGDRLYMETNWEAPNGRILLAEVRNPKREAWKEIVPEAKEAIDSFSLVGGRLFVSYLKSVASEVVVFDPDGKRLGTVALPQIGSAGVPRGWWGKDEGFFNFVSFTYPSTSFHYRVSRNSSEVWHRTQVPVDTERLAVRQVWYRSKDGTRVPMFLVHAKGLKTDGRRPVYLTGYGGFTLSQTPRFSAFAAMWSESGGIYALPALRGGGEFGEAWHRAGMLERKQNTFDDLIAAAEWLIAQGYTAPDRVAIAGGSNGGLLVGAAMTQRPDLFRAVVCHVPLLDMLRYHRFLVARFWVPEYGSADEKEQFPWLHAYSPYHRVRPQERYPAVLFVSGDGDTRVAPLHARKMTALMQSSSGSGLPVLLRYDTKAGHSGGRPLSKIIEDYAEEFLFVYWQLGAPLPKPAEHRVPAAALGSR